MVWVRKHKNSFFAVNDVEQVPIFTTFVQVNFIEESVHVVGIEKNKLKDKMEEDQNMEYDYESDSSNASCLPTIIRLSYSEI